MLPPLSILFAFPLVAIALFASLPKRQAIIWTILAGYLFLPPQIGYNLPMLPRLNKETITPFSILLCLAFFASRPLSGPQVQPGLLPKHPLILVLFFVTVLSGMMTALTNTDRLVFGPVTLPALRVYDGLSMAQTSLMIVLPMLIARKYLADEASHKLLLKVLAIAGAIYSLPIVFELVMSPQLNNIVYGFFPRSWGQHVRSGGYRPLVFVEHGLKLAIFMCCTMLAALAYMRLAEPNKRFIYAALAGWLFVILMLSNSFGAFAIAIVFLPAVLFLGVRLQLLAAAVISLSLLAYPILRVTDTMPVWQFADKIEQYDPSRAGSFRYRLFNEDALLERASERPLFGWGPWDRARVFDEDGRDQSTTDGFWTIQLGDRGWVGYLSLVGLLTVPTILLAMRKRISLATSGLCLVLAANLIDLVPNAGLSIVTWIIAGALAGRLERQGAEDELGNESSSPAPRAPPGYSRFGSVKPVAQASAAGPGQNRIFEENRLNAS